MQSADNEIVLGILFTTLFLLLLVAGIFISVSVAARQRMRQEVRLTQLELDYERELRSVEAEVSEQMMEQFAQELHDNIGHSLTLMRVQLENKKYDQPELAPVFQPIEDALTDASQQLRLLSHTLNTEFINNIGLEQAIALEVQKLRQLKRQQVHWTNQFSGALTLKKDQELVVFRIFQEMIQNVLKHAKCKNIYIQLSDDENALLTVSDDGKGFDAAGTLASPAGSGLKNIIKRAKMAGMQCRIHSTSGSGCRYVVGLAPALESS